MFSIGYITVVLYVAALAFFMIAAYYPNVFMPSSVMGVISFLGATVILGLMIFKRRMTEFKK
jgi:hypothetical protein